MAQEDNVWRPSRNLGPIFSMIKMCFLLNDQLIVICQVMFYSTSTFEKAGISDPDVATCGTGVVSIIVIGISVCDTILWIFHCIPKN